MEFLREVLALKAKVPHKSNPYIESALKLVEEYYGLTPAGNVIGALGDVIFEVSSEKVETLRDVKRQSRARLATHEIVAGKSVLEFLGLEPDEITFTMQLNADLGVDVRAEHTRLLNMLREGEPQWLVLGGRALGQGRWYVTELTARTEHTDGWGLATFVTLDVTLREAI